MGSIFPEQTAAAFLLCLGSYRSPISTSPSLSHWYSFSYHFSLSPLTFLPPSLLPIHQLPVGEYHSHNPEFKAAAEKRNTHLCCTCWWAPGQHWGWGWLRGYWNGNWAPGGTLLLAPHYCPPHPLHWSAQHWSIHTAKRADTTDIRHTDMLTKARKNKRQNSYCTHTTIITIFMFIFKICSGGNNYFIHCWICKFVHKVMKSLEVLW